MQLVDQSVGARRDRGVELIFRVGLHVAMEFRTLNGDVLHLPRIDLVQQVGIGDLRVLAPHVGAALDNAPQQHQADEDKDPEHDRFDGRIHQDSSFPAGEKPRRATSITAYSIPI